MKAILALEDGRLFEGRAFGATGTTTGEICFNTSMTGYQEVITDPSYRGQIVAMTYPQIGNYGINPDYRRALEAAGLRVSGVGAEGEIRIVELPSHRFFLATLFLPQTRSTATRPHPLLAAFAAAARARGPAPG